MLPQPPQHDASRATHPNAIFRGPRPWPRNHQSAPDREWRRAVSGHQKDLARVGALHFGARRKATHIHIPRIGRVRARHKSRFSGNRRAIGNITRSRWRSDRRRSYWSRGRSRWSKRVNDRLFHITFRCGSGRGVLGSRTSSTISEAVGAAVETRGIFIAGFASRENQNGHCGTKNDQGRFFHRI